MEQESIGSGLEYTIFRPSFVFGRGGALPTFMKQVRYSPVVTVIGSGEPRIQPIWIDDVAAHFARALDTPAAANKTFEIGGPDIVTWDELYRTIAKVLGKRRGLAHVPAAARTHRGAAHPVDPGRAAHSRPDRDDRSRRQRRHEQRCHPHVPAPTRPPRRADPPRSLNHALSLLLLLVAANQRMVQLVERELAADGVDANGYASLSLIGVRGEMRLTELADQLGMPLTTMSDVVRRLEGRGLVRRRPNPDDGRSFLFELTARGDREWRRGWGALQRIDEQLQRDVDFDEMRTVADGARCRVRAGVNRRLIRVRSNSSGLGLCSSHGPDTHRPPRGHGADRRRSERRREDPGRRRRPRRAPPQPAASGSGSASTASRISSRSIQRRTRSSRGPASARARAGSATARARCGSRTRTRRRSAASR